MADGGLPAGMSFPQKVHTEDEDFVIELDENHMAYDDRSRCKRRKRCGQCGPCQVKENCNKCHFCIRKDVLKQTCIYRKCVYLRSKPKPYNRPHQSPQGRNAISPPRDTTQPSPHVKSPPLAAPHAGIPFGEPGINMPGPRPENRFFPPQLPQQASEGTQQNNGYLPANPASIERTPSLPNTAGNMNMQMNMSPHVPNHASSPPILKPPDPASPPVVPQPVNSPMAALSGIPISSCSSVPHISPMAAVGRTIPPVMPQMSNNALSNVPPIPNMPGIAERPMNDFRHSDQFSLGHHHPHPHFPPVHPHNVMPPRDSGLFGEHSRIPHMNFNHSNPMETLTRGPNDSSCMYHPGLPYSMPGHYQTSGPSFLPGASEMNPFRSNFLNSFPPGYSYPPDRYREGFGPLPFSRLGISSSTSFPQYPGQTGGYGVGNYSQQYYNSQHGCPKNGSRPPVSPSIDDVKVIQEGYKNKESAKSDNSSAIVIKQEINQDYEDSGRNRKDESSELGHSLSQRPSGIERSNSFNLSPLSPRFDHLRPWNEFFNHRSFPRHDAFLSPYSKASHIEPWRMSPWFSPRRDDVRSRASTSTLSSDFECEVISIDDQQVNALIRSDGCNSIEIEFDNRSISSNDLSPRKLLSRSSTALSDLVSPDRGSFCDERVPFPPWLDNSSVRRNLCEKSREDSIKKAFNLFDPAEIHNKKATKERKKSGNGERSVRRKSSFKDNVCIKQDLGEEGIVQLELPGHRVSIENVLFTDDLLKNSSNIAELKKFISGHTDAGIEQVA